MRSWVRSAVTGAGAALVLWTAGTATASAAEADPGALVVRTVPSTPGARVAAEGTVATANARGVARLPVQNVAALDERFNVPETRVSTDRRVTLDRIVGSPRHGVSRPPLVVGLRTERLVSWSFLDRQAAPVPLDRISLLEMRSNAGEVVRIEGRNLERPRWMAAGRTQQTQQGLISKKQYWSVTRVVVDGADVVNRAQQVFVPEESQHWEIELLFYRVEVEGSDLLFGSRAGEGLAITRPDGVTERLPFRDGRVTLRALPRGTYDVQIYGPGLSFTRPMSVSKDQAVRIEVISPLDLALVATVVVLVAISLVLVGRRHHVIRLHRRSVELLRRAASSTTVLALAVLVCSVLLIVVGIPLARADTRVPVRDDPPKSAEQVPTFAYYYIWYQPTSWRRAKKDYPLLGRYSSDDRVILSRHVSMAKAAGLTGFLVSWKGSKDLDSRLRQLVDIAENKDFKLGIVYQGLDFYRNPLPVSTVARDLDRFADEYAESPAFDTFPKPVVVITGTEDYTLSQLQRATAEVRDRLLILASAKSVEEYRRTASVMDGDAYYWSSAHPDRPFYAAKMGEMSRAVHADGGLWLAPAAAGFDARMLGGTQVVRREGGRTLSTAIDLAWRSNPDAVAVISWNEFSENSHVEPSETFADQELKVLAAKLGGEAVLPPRVGPIPSRDGGAGLTGWGALVVILLVGVVMNLMFLIRGSSRGQSQGPAPLATGDSQVLEDQPTTANRVGPAVVTSRASIQAASGAPRSGREHGHVTERGAER